MKLSKAERAVLRKMQSAGGRTTVKRRGKGWMKKISKKGVEARRKLKTTA